jgi:inward rectifier potassium channel
VSEPPLPPAPEESRDLGFGSVVARESRLRLLNRDGSFNVTRHGLEFWRSLGLYHWLLTRTWPRFLGVVAGSYVLVNFFFAAVFGLLGPAALAAPGPGAPPPGFARSFFFSVETFSTIGYGNIVPVGAAANLAVTVEAFVGLLWLALSTGLVFARFSRPTAQIVFSRGAVIAPYRGITAFEFRIANERRNQIIELEAKVLFSSLREEDGRRVRRFEPLRLERDRVVFFPLSWTVVHPIDEESPLRGLSAADLRSADAEFLVLLTGIDETFSQTVHARSSYKGDEVVWNAKFADLYRHRQGEEPIAIDMARFHDVEPAAGG